jgi:hypothetical protein
MKYTVYKTINLVNNKIYVGLHETKNPNDGYLGSGVFLKKAIKKYGKHNFKKEVLFIFDDKNNMIKKEKEIVNEAFIKRKDTYNMTKGGFGLSTLSEEEKIKAIEKMKLTKKGLDYKKIAKKRINNMLTNDPNCFKKIANKSAIKQKENYKNGYINPKQRLDDVLIFDLNHNLKHKSKRINFKELCEKNSLPERVLIASMQQKGKPLYQKQKPQKSVYLKYKGWYAIYENDYKSSCSKK